MTFKRDAGVPFQKLEEETIVVDPRTREVHLLNDTAARIWELTKVELGEGELGLGCGTDLSDGTGHAHGFAEAFGGWRPLALLQAPLAAEQMERAYDAAVPARFGPLFGTGELPFVQITQPEAE